MRYGAVDIGTNAMRLLIAEVDNGEIRWLDRRTTVTALGRGVDRTGHLADEAVARTVAVLAGYGDALRAAGVERSRAIATSAARDADNREQFLDLAEEALSVRPDVIGGHEEAALAFAGAISTVESDPPYVVVDVGGGSTEFVMGTTAPEYQVSVDIGSVRLTDRAFPMLPPDTEALEAARAMASALLDGVALPARPATAVGVAGTFTALSAISQDLPVYDPGRVDGSRLSVSRLAELVLYLAGLTLAETQSIPSLDPARAPVILAGAVVAEEAVRRCGLADIIVSEHDTLDGIVLRLAEE